MNKIIQLGNLFEGTEKFRNPQTGRIYSIEGLAPTLNTCGGGMREPKVVERNKMNKLVCERRMDEGLRTFKDDVIGTIRTIEWKEQDGVLYVDKEILSDENKENVQADDNSDFGYRIRKLTPKECFRLMAFSDEDFDKAKAAGVSNSQLYKQAGNSIVVDVLYYIFINLYKVMPYLFDDLKVGSYFSGIGAFEKALDKTFDSINSGNFTQPQVE